MYMEKDKRFRPILVILSRSMAGLRPGAVAPSAQTVKLYASLVKVWKEYADLLNYKNYASFRCRCFNNGKFNRLFLTQFGSKVFVERVDRCYKDDFKNPKVQSYLHNGGLFTR
jgi:hypothetical protein